jgi:flap endonuclease-1
MGVNLSELAVTELITFEFLTGKTLAVDALNMIYQFLGNIRQADGTPLMDSKGNVTSHLSGLFYRNVNFIERGMKLVYVFDGKPPEAKRSELDTRNNARSDAKEKWANALQEGRLEEAKKFAQRSSVVTDEMVEESKKLLQAMGIPVVQAMSEGEAQCAKICQDGKAFASVTQDFDALLFGSPRTIRNLSVSKAESLQMMSLPNQKYTREQFILMGILVGTDYNPGGVLGIGPKKALAMVEKCKTLEEIQKNIEWKFDLTPKDLFDFFMNPPVEQNYEIKFSRPDREKLIKILHEEHDFSEERVEKNLGKLEEKKATQTNLLGF